MSVNYTTTELLTKNLSSAFTIWNTTVNHDTVKYIESVSKTSYSHLFLLFLDNKVDFKIVADILKTKKIRNHGFITVQYQTVGTGDLKPIAQTCLLLSNNLQLDPHRTGWFRPDLGFASNVWDLTPHNSLIGCQEEIKEVPFGYVSFELLILMQQLASPLSIQKFNYIGRPNKSIIRYSEKVLNCNLVEIN